MKPVLYLDIDGVLFGLYGQPETFQLRPGVTSFLTFVHKHFQLCWLTGWSQPAVVQLCESIYFPQVAQTHYINWTNYAEKEIWLAERRGSLASVQWFWIDDRLPEPTRLRELGLDPSRCFLSDPTGADELLRLQNSLMGQVA